MKLPNAHIAAIPKDMLIGYLLNPTHPRGRSKAAFFRSLGFDMANPDALAAELMRHALHNDAWVQTDSEFGVRYVIDGWIVSPTGRQARIRTVWFVDNGSDVPRFVTAYPATRGGR